LEKTKLKPTTPEEPPKNQKILMLQNQDWRLSSSQGRSAQHSKNPQISSLILHKRL
jgi:hypothetical protein